MATVVECWHKGRLEAHHRAPAQLTGDEILKRFGLENSRYTVIVYPEGRPDQAETIRRHREGGIGQ